MTLGFSDGERLYRVRYSSEHRSRTLYVSADRARVLALHPHNERFQRLTDEDASSSLSRCPICPAYGWPCPS